MTSRASIPTVGWLLAGIGVVATIQGVAWLAAVDGPSGRAPLGVALACLGILGTGAGIVHALLPSFFG